MSAINARATFSSRNVAREHDEHIRLAVRRIDDRGVVQHAGDQSRLVRDLHPDRQARGNLAR